MEKSEKRFLAACMFIQGLLSNPNIKEISNSEMIEQVYSLADELLRQEELD